MSCEKDRKKICDLFHFVVTREPYAVNIFWCLTNLSNRGCRLLVDLSVDFINVVICITNYDCRIVFADISAHDI